jgi:hypothetical protein
MRGNPKMYYRELYDKIMYLNKRTRVVCFDILGRGLICHSTHCYRGLNNLIIEESEFFVWYNHLFPTRIVGGFLFRLLPRTQLTKIITKQDMEYPYPV